MQLWELSAGDKVTLEVVWGTAVYPLNAVVYRPVNDGIYIRAFYKNGQLLDFASKAFSQATYNLYANLENGGSRVVWKNVSISLVKLKVDYFYQIDVSAFAKNSSEVNRRNDVRVKIFGAGIITLNGEESHTVLMKDISNSGVAFVIGEDVELVDETFELEFCDEANGHDYDLCMRCRGVRKVPQNHGTLIGCSIIEGCKDLLFYVYYKLLEAKAIENTEQLLKMDTSTVTTPEKEPPKKKSVGMRFERKR